MYFIFSLPPVCILLIVTVATISPSGPTDAVSMGTKNSGETRAKFGKLYDTSGFLFTSTAHPLDKGQEMLEHMFQDFPGFKYDIGFRWTGKEVLCNCTATYCGTKNILHMFQAFQVKNVCIGLACYHQKRLHQLQSGQIVEDEHMGCYGGDADTHDHHDQHEPLFCADTPHVRTRCCWSSFCQQELPPFDFPFHEDLERQKQRDKHSWYMGLYIIIGTAVIMFFVFIGVLYYLIRSKRPKWFFQKFGKKRRGGVGTGDESIMMNLNLEPRQPPAFAANYQLLNNESGGTSNNDEHPLMLMTPQAASTSDGLNSHPLNQLLRDLDESGATGEFSSGLLGHLCQKNTFLGEVEREQPPIGQGRYGTVFRCRWKGQVVAMKVLISRYEHSYYREVAMYRSGILRHTNILQFLGNDLIVDNAMEMCMVFEYHANGSLDSYLSTNTVDIPTAIRMIYSMNSGLAFLHAPMETSCATKPGIAHRDFKSGNILVKSNLMVCISDLGLAVCNVDGRIGIPKPTSSDHFEIDYKPDEKIEMCGTMRYLSPELLSGDFDWSVFESFKAADIYSMALVMYEICRRIKIDGEEEVPYAMAMPFFRQIAENGGFLGDVDFEVMKKILCEDGSRPDDSDWWQRNDITMELSRLMHESWASDPQSRLTAQNIIRALERLAKKINVSLDQT